MASVDSILKRDFNELSKPIQGASPTEDICNALKYGFSPNGKPALTPHEKRARAVWTIKRVERVLDEAESLYLVVRYGGHLEACAEMAQSLAQQTKHMTADEISAVLDFLFTKITYKKAVQLEDRFAWQPRQTYRKIASVRRILAKMHDQLMPKLEIALQAELTRN